jgi:hypothetical protein
MLDGSRHCGPEERKMPRSKIEINRAPVLTLWAAVVAERQGYDSSAALTLGRGLAGLNAQSKGRRLGMFEAKGDGPAGKKDKEEARPNAQSVVLLGRAVPVVKTAQGLRAAAAGKALDPRSVQSYLEQKFGDRLDEARSAMERLAGAYAPAQLEAEAYALYEKFRPRIPEGKKGWGAKGELDLDLIRSLGK